MQTCTDMIKVGIQSSEMKTTHGSKHFQDTRLTLQTYRQNTTTEYEEKCAIHVMLNAQGKACELLSTTSQRQILLQSPA